ncbi:MAG TPA: cysteine--tRNA ligase [Kutzneria sp.]|nr:cysteine--tRNA ligase [Kutzneria sp.]
MTVPQQISLGGRTVPLLDRARIYTCGITPYDVTHLGHAATFVWADALARILRALSVEPVVCRNVTDVDDVLDAAAHRAGDYYDRFAAVQQFRFENDMALLNVRPPEHEPRAHRYVDVVVRLAAALLATGDAYVRGGSVYFRGRRVVETGGLDPDRAAALAAEYGGRLDDPAKADPFDVAVWQAAEAGHPSWDSPWGPGRPGWHAECVAMSLSVFGTGVDFHAGGADLAFPHHAYHRAMAEAVTGVRPYARAWLHVGTVTVDGAKMAKSAGNLVLVEDLLAAAPAAVVRMMVLDRPWALSWDYTEDLLDRAADRVERLYAAAGRPGGDPGGVLALLARDLDVAGAVDLALAEGGAAARLLASVLGLA